eukprot:2003074-Prymnesium_polylepis.1
MGNGTVRGSWDNGPTECVHQGSRSPRAAWMRIPEGDPRYAGAADVVHVGDDARDVELARAAVARVPTPEVVL